MHHARSVAMSKKRSRLPGVKRQQVCLVSFHTLSLHGSVEIGLQREGERRVIAAFEFFQQRRAHEAGESAGETSAESRAGRGGSKKSLAMQRRAVGFLAGEKSGSDLHRVGTELKGRPDAMGLRDASGRDHRPARDFSHLRHERKRARERVLGRTQEARTMSACIGTRRDDHIDAGLIECGGFFERRSGTHGQNAALGAFKQDFGIWDAKHETEHLGAQFENHLHLLLKREIVRWLDGRHRNAETFINRRKLPQTERVMLRCHHFCAWIMSRYPQVDVEGLRRGSLQIVNHLAHLIRRQMMRSEGAESACIRNSGSEPHRRQSAAKRTLYNRMLDADA
ncbi:MAG: hypothetical protein JNN17_17320 [Verrucomicrobiaceae bacterium]|nr:hypothetical protein [Verrucomicrobiaceae bacterium]